METEIAAVLAVAPKLEFLQKLLDRRIERASTDVVSPTLPLLEKVYRLGEYKRLAANLAVMAHRIRCGLGDEATDTLLRAAVRGSAADVETYKKARRILENLGVTPVRLREYFALPLYRAEYRRLSAACARKRVGELCAPAADTPYAPPVESKERACVGAWR